MRVPSPIFSSALFPSLWPWAKRFTSSLVAGLFILTSVVGWATPAQAQATTFQPVTALTVVNDPATLVSIAPNTPYTTPCDNNNSLIGCDGATVNLTFGVGGNRVLNSFAAGGLTLTRVIVPGEDVILRRQGAEGRSILFYESTAVNGGPPPTDISLAPEQADDIPRILLSSFVNRGIDNVFNNDGFNPNPPGNPNNFGQDTRNNIERIDYIVRNGVVVPPAAQNQEGFLVLERGGNDAFGIAAITSLDAAGNPNGYGPLIRVPAAAASWGTATEVNIPSVVFRRESPLDPLLPSHQVDPQPVRGIFFPISSLLPAPQSNQPVFGYSLVANDVLVGGNALVNWNVFPPGTGSDSNSGGLDLVAGGFGLFRVPRGELFLNKRITQITASGTVTPFPGTINPDNNLGFPALAAAGLGQGTVTITNPQLRPGDEVEYTLYFNNTGNGNAGNIQICDQIPPGSTFVPNAFGTGRGVQAISPTNAQNPPVNYPTVTYTNAADGDPATFFPPGTPLPAVCGPDQGNGAVVVAFPTVGPSQVGYVRFRATVNPF